ncbi:MAG: FGGY-family carbohydrate kinase [Caldilineaceae bacterium]
MRYAPASSGPTSAQAQGARIATACGENTVYQRTGHRPSAAYTAAKILWIRDEQPTVFAQTACFLQPKDFIVHRLTGIFAIDYSDASATLLFDLTTRSWSDEIIQALGLTKDQLPLTVPSTTVVGTVTAVAAAATGLATGTPVVIGGGDGACAATGAGVIEPGQAYCYIGSSSWIGISTAQPLLDPDQRTFTFHHLHPERYTPTGTMQSGGGARDWAWHVLQDDQDLDALAATVQPGAERLLFLPYLLGERSPHWNPHARGAFVGLAMPHERPQMARAVLEGVALNLRLILDAMRASMGERATPIRAMRLIGGGGNSRLWPQMLADCFNLPIHQLTLTGEATSWGAAVAAGVAIGLYEWSLAAERATVTNVIEPDPTTVALYAELATIYTDTYRALEPIYGRLAQLGMRG